jgi:hypothetical protein
LVWTNRRQIALAFTTLFPLRLADSLQSLSAPE